MDSEICDTSDQAIHQTLVTVCSWEEFTCSDGACISMERRCDQFPNCADFSDEANCQLVVKGDNYLTDYTPFTNDEQGKLIKTDVQIRIQLIRILNIDEVGQIFRNQFYMFMTWYL